MMWIVILLVVVIVIIALCVKIVPQATCFVVEFLGSYQATWQNGLHFKIPFIQRIAKKVSLKEQVADFPPQPVITKDNVTMKIDTVVYYKIFDAKLFTYGVENPIMALENLTATTLRNIIGDLELDQTLTSRDVINNKMRDIIDIATDPWGIKVNRIELKNIIPPQEIQQAMEKQMKAEREKRQTLLEAEAHRESVVARAEGDKQAKILAAEAERDSQIALAQGRAESIKLVYEAEAKGLETLKNAKIDESVVTLKKLDALKAVGDGRATKIFMPTELTSLATTLGTAAELLGTNASMPIDKSPKIEIKKEVEDVCCEDKK
ncbi:MAG: SPFH domain-containing protein [Clostridia bacterium]